MDESIGQILAQSRTNLGKTIKEVEFDTKIRGKYIEALEAENFDSLPGHIYAQGFLKTYATYLGLDAAALTSMYKSRFGEEDAGELIKVSSNIRIETKKRPRWFVPAVVVAGVVAVFVGLIIWGAIAQNMSKEPNIVVQSVKTKQTLETAVVAGASTSTTAKKNNSDSATDKSSSTTSSSTTSTTDRKNDGKIDVTVKLTGIDGTGSWARVLVDGEKQFVGVVEDGQTKQFEGDSSVTVRIGNAPGMEIMVNGKKISVKKLKTINGVIEDTFTKESLKDMTTEKSNG